MTTDQMNVAIALLCGWKKSDAKTPRYDSVWVLNDPLTYSPDVPDYCHDLNAMHDAESAVLNEDLCVKYSDALWIFVIGPKHDPKFPAVSPNIYMWHVSAREKAEALLRATGKWF